MSEKLEQRKIFLIASADERRRNEIEALITTHVENATIFQAADGIEAWSKADNLPPHVVIAEGNLPRRTGVQLTEQILKSKNQADAAIVLLSDPPGEQVFVDEVVTGRVQFIGGALEHSRVRKAIAKALNDVSVRQATSEPATEFRLKFLATGDLLIRQGDTATSVYLLRRGQLNVLIRNEKGSTQIGTVEAGEFVGEMAYINHEPRSADVTAATECELVEIPIDHLDHVLYRKPAWSKALMTTLSKRIKRSNAMALAAKKP